MALFYMDMRTPRKDFEKYMVRIQRPGGPADPLPGAQHYRRRARTATWRSDTSPKTGEVRDEIFDMVVLSVGMEIPPDTVDLAEKLEVPLSPNDFVETSCFAPDHHLPGGDLSPAAPSTAPRTSPSR